MIHCHSLAAFCGLLFFLKKQNPWAPVWKHVPALTGWKWDILFSLLLLWCSATTEKPFWFSAARVLLRVAAALFDWQKQMSNMFIFESLKRCQCHPTVSLNLCNRSERNCQPSLGSFSHTWWKSRLHCHSYLIHTRPRAVWVDVVVDICEDEQKTIKLCLLTKKPRKPEMKWGYWAVKSRSWSFTSRDRLHIDVSARAEQRLAHQQIEFV